MQWFNGRAVIPLMDILRNSEVTMTSTPPPPDPSIRYQGIAFQLRRREPAARLVRLWTPLSTGGLTGWYLELTAVLGESFYIGPIPDSLIEEAHGHAK